MPRCLVVGCDERKKGRQCDCPRRSLRICQHVRAKIEQYAGLTVEEAARKADRWSELLWALFPSEYGDKPLAHEPFPCATRADAVNLMRMRHNMNLGLWHPDDTRGLQQGNRKRSVAVGSQVRGLQHLVRAITVARNVGSS